MDDISHQDESLVLLSLGRLHKLVVEVVRADGVGQLPEVHFEQGGHGVNVLQHAPVVVEVGHAVFVEGNPQLLNVGGDSGEPIDSIDDSAFLDKFRAMSQNFGD